MNKKFRNKIDLAHHYTLVFAENDAFALKVETENDVIYFDGKDGDVVIESEPFSDEPYISTVDEMVDNFGEMLQDWGVDFDTAQAICIDLTPWFEKYAISEEDAILNEITALENFVNSRRELMADLAKRNDIRRATIAEQNHYISKNVDRILEINAEVEGFEKTIAELKAQLN